MCDRAVAYLVIKSDSNGAEPRQMTTFVIILFFHLYSRSVGTCIRFKEFGLIFDHFLGTPYIITSWAEKSWTPLEQEDMF
jgi:hypothetical protein